jgi:tetratricopeptide (TPR) repeat protein
VAAQRLGRYELTGTLGRGANGVVFRARLPGASEDAYAIKLLHRADLDAVQRFDRERRVLATRALVGFVPLLESGVSPEGPWLAMPLLTGGDLRRKLRAGPLPADEAIELGRALARALGTAHGAGIVHRDVKPENILFDGAGRPLIADLGLARHFQLDPRITQSAALTKTGEMAGTIGYAPREQLADAASVDASADVFALGAVLFECLDGRPAFQGESALEVVQMIERGDRPRLERSDLPRHVVLAIERALDRDPGNRYQDGAAFAAALSDEAELGELQQAISRRAWSARLRSVSPAWLSLAGLVVASLVLALVAAGRPTERRGQAPPAATTTATTATTSAAAIVSSARPVARALVPLYRPRPRSRPPDTIRGLELLQKALSAQSDNDFRRAIALAEEGLDADPESARLWVVHGRARKSGGLPGALDDAEEALRLDPELASAWSLKGDVLAAEGDLKALEAADRCIVLEPDRAMWWRERANVRWTLGVDRSRCLEDLRRAYELDDSSSFRHLDLETLVGRLAELGRPEDAIAILSSVIALAPQDANAWSLLGHQLWVAGRRNAALDAVTHAVDLAPKDPGFRRHRAELLTGLESWKEALAECDVWIALAPQDTEPWLHRASVHEAQSDWGAVIDDCLHARSLDPKLAAAWDRSAKARNQLGKHEEALKEAEQAIALAPRSPNGWFERALARRALRDREGARADLDQAIAVAPGWEWSYWLRGTLRRELGDVDGAIADHREYLRLFGEKPFLLGELVEDYLVKGDADAALAAADRAFALEPGKANPLELRGRARLAKGQFDAALSDLDAAAVLAPKDVLTYRDRGCARANLGDFEGARADFVRCAPDPDAPPSFYWRGFVREKLGDRPGAASDFAACLAAGAKGATADLARAALARVK